MTNMIDSVIETYQPGDVPEELEKRKIEILNQVNLLSIVTEK